MTLTYGIYPGGRAGTVSSGPIDPHRTAALIDDLGGGRRFVVREYVHFLGREPEQTLAASIGAETPLAGLPMPDDWYVQGGRALDLVVSYIPPAADVSGWLEFLEAVVARYGHLAAYQLFGLRDAHSGVEQATGTLGITTDRYEPKPAYATYRDIVRCARRSPNSSSDPFRTSSAATVSRSRART